MGDWVDEINCADIFYLKHIKEILIDDGIENIDDEALKSALYTCWLNRNIYFYTILGKIGCAGFKIGKYQPQKKDGKILWHEKTIFKQVEIYPCIPFIEHRLTNRNTVEIPKIIAFLEDYPNIKEIFNLYDNGKSRKEIANYIHEKRHIPQGASAYIVNEDKNQLDYVSFQKKYQRDYKK